jgi:hypothetical protein
LASTLVHAVLAIIRGIGFPKQQKNDIWVYMGCKEEKKP